MNNSAFDALTAANPVPSTELSELDAARQRRNLRSILGTQNWKAAAAAVGVLALAGLSIPMMDQPVSAQEVLTQAATAAATRPALNDAPTNVGFIQRTDASADGSITTSYKATLTGALDVQTQVEGTPSAELSQWADSHVITPREDIERATTPADITALAGEDFTRGALELLMNPYLSARQQHMVFELLANEEGSTVLDSSGTGEDTHVTIRHDDLTFTLIPATGQLTSVHNLVDPDITTTVAASAIIGCVNVTGLQGPDTISTACADNNYQVNSITWDTWGDEESVGHGTAWINDCDPYCAEGQFHTYPVTVKVYAKQECGYQADIYSTLDVIFTDPTLNETFSIGCV